MSGLRQEQVDQLRQVLTDWAKPKGELIGKLPKGGTSLDYMGHAAVTRVLIEVDPEWSWEPVCDERGIPIVEHEGKRLVMWGHLTVLGKTLMCCGTCEDRKFEPEKELIGDLLRNGAMRFGIGLSLWSKDEWHDTPAGPVSPPEPKVSEDTWAKVSALKETLPPTVLVDLKAWVSANGWRFTRQGLTEDQAQQALAWAERRQTEPTLEDVQ